jgi:hypothetical protein
MTAHSAAGALLLHERALQVLARIGACRSTSPTKKLETAARACRATAYQEGERAKKMENPTMRLPIENTAKRPAALAEKFEAARKKRSA